MNKRKIAGVDHETQVLTKSQRRCCLCYFLENDKSEKKGQIAHLNQDRSDSSMENLVWLCLEHHDAYDSRTSQSKGYTKTEVKKYRDELYKVVSFPTAHQKTIVKEYTQDCWSDKREIVIPHDFEYNPTVIITDPITDQVIEYTIFYKKYEVIISGNTKDPIVVQLRQAD